MSLENYDITILQNVSFVASMHIADWNSRANLFRDNMDACTDEDAKKQLYMQAYDDIDEMLTILPLNVPVGAYMHRAFPKFKDNYKDLVKVVNIFMCYFPKS